MNLKHVSLLQQTTKRRKGYNPQITFHGTRLNTSRKAESEGDGVYVSGLQGTY